LWTRYSCGGSKFLDDPRVNGRIAIWGRSRGAIVTAQLIARMNNFRGAVLQAGSYDLQKDYAIPKPGRLDGIRRTIESQIKGELQAGLHDRSAIHNVSRISCPVLLLHGEKDENVRVEQARMMDEALSAANVPHELRIIPEAAHDIERETRLQFTMPFLRKVLAQ
jgi:dipeptidyl aminopeptidase/acylaminoacyl peptidase